MKTTVVLLLLGCLAACVGGCDRRADAGEEPAIRIVYWAPSWWGDPKQFQGENPVSIEQWKRQRLAEFERRNPGVKVDWKVDPGSPDRLRLAFAGGVPPDVFHTVPGSEFLTWADLGFLEPIDPFLTPEDRADIFPAALSSGQYRGQHYVWPLYNHALCVVINRDLFRERGLEDRIPGPDSDWTMAEFEALARELTFDRDGDGRTDVYGVGMHCVDDNHVFLTTYLINFGARVFAPDGTFVLDSPQGIRGMQFLRRLIDQRIATPGAAAYKHEQVRSLFLEQKVAMFLCPAGIVDWAEDQAAKGTIRKFDWALVPIPHEPDARPVSFLTIGTVLVSKQDDPAKRKACMELARYITGPEVNRIFWRKASPRRSTPTPADENMAVMMRQVERAENFMLPPIRLPDRYNLTREMVRLYQDVLAYPPRATPEEGLRGTSARVNAAVKEATGRAEAPVPSPGIAGVAAARRKDEGGDR